MGGANSRPLALRLFKDWTLPKGMALRATGRLAWYTSVEEEEEPDREDPDYAWVAEIIRRRRFFTGTLDRWAGPV